MLFICLKVFFKFNKVYTFCPANAGLSSPFYLKAKKSLNSKSVFRKFNNTFKNVSNVNGKATDHLVEMPKSDDVILDNVLCLK